MPETRRLPNIECPNEDHPEGNRFMEHVGTRRPRPEVAEPAEDTHAVAMFQCVKCKRVTTQPFDQPPPATD